MINTDQIRNIAIIAHVDHGKTTLVDGLLKQAHVFADYQSEMQQTTILDSNDLERERGVTILAKNTAVNWHGFKINILDTPGHADFSGEVERVLNMADGCLLLVDASEGVLSQTRYVLFLALKLNLKPIVIINKVDRKDQRVEAVLNEINDLFLDLASDESQLDFPVLYGVGRDGVIGRQTELQPDNSLKITDSTSLEPLFQTIVDTVPAPSGELNGPFQMQVNSLDADEYKGQYVIGRVKQGKIKPGEMVNVLRGTEKVGQVRVDYVFTYQGLKRLEANEAQVGDIIALANFPQVNIGDTISDPILNEGLAPLMINEPTVQIQLRVSDSPLAGKEGTMTTSRQIEERLKKELKTNVSLRMSKTGPDNFLLSGRGELHLAILIETMRREGFEFAVGRPEVIFKEIDGRVEEPWELVTIEVPEEYAGIVTSEMGKRKAIFKNMHQQKTGLRYEYEAATRHLIGFRSDFAIETSGLGAINSLFLGYRVKSEDVPWSRNGVIIAADYGMALSYSLQKIQERGATFVDPGTKVYAGMIVGQNTKPQDLVMNVTKAKKQTNVRAASAEVMVRMAPPVKMSLEQALVFLASDELLEVTPLNLRLRKKDLSVANR